MNLPIYYGNLRSQIEKEPEKFDKIMKDVPDNLHSDIKSIAHTSYFYTRCETAERILEWLKKT